jgi:ubiquinone/menaquinone biosynthesis C-methylase UbiE
MTSARPDLYTEDRLKEWDRMDGGGGFPFHRQRVALEALAELDAPKAADFVDLGSGDGLFAAAVTEMHPTWNITLLDGSESQLHRASERCPDAKLQHADLNEPLPFETGSLDVVHAGELIEHLYSPDVFLRECRRVLRPNGWLIVTTPNLCAWYNRLLFPLGILPIFYEISSESTHYGIGWLKAMKSSDQPVGHIRVMNHSGLVEIMESNGFDVSEVKTAIFDVDAPTLFKLVDRMVLASPALSSNFIAVARPSAVGG